MIIKDGENDGVMLKTKRLFSLSPKSNSANYQKIWSFRTPQRKDRKKETVTFSELHPVNPSTAPSFLRRSFLNMHTSFRDSNDPESLHCAIAPILLIAQLFGILPVSGILKPSPFKLRFVKFSFRTAHAVSTTIMVIVMAILAVIHMIRTLNAASFEVRGGVMFATIGAIFYGDSAIGLIIFLCLSPRWVIFQRDWRTMEQFIDRNKMDRPKLRWKFYAIAASMLILGVMEHSLHIAMTTEKHDWSGETKNSTFSNFLEIYCATSHAYILETLRYNFALGIFIFIVIKLASFTWYFIDIFIMMISTGLAERYKLLNKQVIASVSKNRTNWNEFREDYAILSCMVKKVDRDIAPIILLSLTNNVYFICMYLLNGFSRIGTTLGDVFFLESFLFLIGRTITVILLIARINDQSKVILPTLYTCSSSSYNIEAKRLIYQLTTDDVVLTGMRFFSITRNFMLAVAGAIITYEVILLQFMYTHE